MNLPVSSLCIILAIYLWCLVQECIFRNKTVLFFYIGHHINTLLMLFWAPSRLWADSWHGLSEGRCLAHAVFHVLLHGIFTRYQWTTVEMAFCSLRMLHRHRLHQHSVARYDESCGTALACWALLWLQCFCPLQVLQQEVATLKCWSALWFSISLLTKGRKVFLSIWWWVTWEGSWYSPVWQKWFPMLPGRVWDCQSSPKKALPP